MKALVVIPTYDEKDNVAHIVRDVLAVDSRLDILIVDDNSPDGTGAIVEEIMQSESRVHLLKRPRKNGTWHSLY